MEPDRPQIAARLRALAAPQRRRLRISAGCAAFAEALWLVQAGALAWSLAGLADGQTGAGGLGAAALIVAAVGLARALLSLRASRLAETAADHVIAATRAPLLARNLRLAPGAGTPASAAVAALLTDKLAMLRPWLLRWHMAEARVMVVPLLILLVSGVISWVAALVLMISGPLIPVFMALVGLAARDASARQMDEIASLNTLLMDRLQALVDIRLLRARPAMLADFTRRADDLRDRTMTVLRIAFLSSAVLELFAALGVAIMAVFVGFTLLGALNFGTWGGLTLAEGVFLLLLAPAFFQPLRDLAAAWHDRISAQAVARDLIADEALALPAIPGAGRQARPLTGAIAFAGGRFRGRDLPPFDLEPGEAVALTGPSGSGKTTLIEMLAGLLPSDGALRVGGHPIGDANADGWRAGLSLISQRVHFLDLSLRQNLTLGRDCSDDDIRAALDLAQAAPLVARLPEGLETRLGENGAGVSGGEARRLTIARAALRQAPVVLADEPTADLDDATAGAVIAALLALHGQGATLIAASHDPRVIAALPRRIEVAP